MPTDASGAAGMWAMSLPWWHFVARGVMVYGFLLVLLRLTGKRQVGQLAPFDLILLLVLSNAGHPPPFWLRTRRDEWAWFDGDSQSHRPGVTGTPLGLLPDASYSRTIVKPEPGDLIVLYSDGVSEATDPSGEELGRDRLLAIARGLDSSSAERFGTELAQAVRAFRGGVPPQDDETIIVLERLSTVDRVSVT